MGCQALLQAVFLTQGWNPHLLRLLHCRQNLYYWATGEAFTHIYIPSETVIHHFTHAFAMLFLTSKPSHLCQEDWSLFAAHSTHPLGLSLGYHLLIL